MARLSNRSMNPARSIPGSSNRLTALCKPKPAVTEHGLPDDAFNMRQLKSMGFSDARLAELTEVETLDVTAKRQALGVRPVYKRIDTCAAEFATPTAYMYSTYETGLSGSGADEIAPSDNKKIIILGGGPNRIGQGIEFDYCCCHAAFALSEAGFETIMINCNPETVSTDYDTSDRLYFEPLTAEDVLEIIHAEQQNGEVLGVIVQFGGQTPLKLASALKDANVPILGTSPDAIDLAEDRDRFKTLLQDLDLKQPENSIAYSVEQAREVAAEIGVPVVIRPSYVLGGRAMKIVRDDAGFTDYMGSTLLELVPPNVSRRFPGDRASQINTVLKSNPLLFDRYLSDATEVDVDALADGKDVFVCGIMEHIEEAGVHSGDSACSLPPHSLAPVVIAELERQTEAMALALNVVGLINVQFAIKDDDVYVLEVNPRASRTVPFVAKAIGLPIAKIAAEVMAGKPLRAFGLVHKPIDHVAVKEAVFPFARFPGVDTLLGPEMRSTGEVMGLDHSFGVAFAKSQLGAGMEVPTSGTAFVAVKDTDKPRVLPAIKQLSELGFRILATGGTQRFLIEQGVNCERINKVLEGRPHIVDAMKNGDVQLVFNTTEGSKALIDSRSLRQTALLNKIPYYTTLSGAIAATKAIAAYKAGSIEVAPLQSYVGESLETAAQ